MQEPSRGQEFVGLLCAGLHLRLRAQFRENSLQSPSNCAFNKVMSQPVAEEEVFDANPAGAVQSVAVPNNF